MASIAVIGDGQSIQCFRSVGFATFAAPDGKTGAEQLRRAVREGYEIVFITETLSVALKDIIQKYKSHPTPAIIPIPSVEGNLGYGMAAAASIPGNAIQGAAGIIVGIAAYKALYAIPYVRRLSV